MKSAITFLLWLCIGGLLVAQVRPPYLPPPRPPKPSTPKVNPKSEEPSPEVSANVDKEIRLFLDDWRDTFIKRDADAMGRFYLQTTEFSAFTLRDPMAVVGWPGYRKALTEFFSRFFSIAHCTFDDLHIVVTGDGSAWLRGLGRVDGVDRDGKPAVGDQARWRQTSLLERRGGRWLIVHEHDSAATQ